MGAIRVEPAKEAMPGEEYRKLKNAIVEAWGAIDDYRVFWDLDEGENPNRVKESFKLVAEKEGIPLRIRRVRGQRTLELSFDVEDSSGPSLTGDTRERILAALAESDAPMSRADIVAVTGISASAWNRRIKELVDEGKVVKLGWRRDSTYRLPS